MKNINQLINSIAYCGLICKLCFQASKCDGCKSVDNKCEQDASDKGCFQKNCCKTKSIEGCWECSGIYDCVEGIYSLGNLSKIKAFAICIKEDGKIKFMENVVKNMKKGRSVEKGKDYDNKPIEEVLNMLRSN